ncbi:hypothetical protein AOC36_10715 [Erysipelothrix larvae]|uniref:Putative N-acetylmannosamine-6-phosphate 2-epimerase n=1 Tax=Erysipelothrix larvae TaxID=1514105 RepID=A0A109UHL6_9FIRM|nr:N-acetylmannosamine-6-phosphate 2-epimerase [Erysipelothrix larvae]AMC94426.1 hypothetical protein AOC36_10715 [Erysipelothrix larvae]
MTHKDILLNKIAGNLIVSCQARPGWAMYGPNIMAAFAVAAQEGGAVAIRATGKENIQAIKNKVSLPILGINKIFNPDYPVYITPTYESAKEILDIGIEIIALDATDRARPNNETFESIVEKIRLNYPDTLIMGEVSTLEEAKSILNLDIDLISTTLSGYTQESEDVHGVNFKLIETIKKITDIPVIAEGKIESPEEAVMALQSGAFAVVVGTSITRPEIITSRYANSLKRMKG